MVLGSWVGHAGQLGLQSLSGGQLTHLHDITETNTVLFGGCWEAEIGECCELMGILFKFPNDNKYSVISRLYLHMKQGHYFTQNVLIKV